MRVWRIDNPRKARGYPPFICAVLVGRDGRVIESAPLLRGLCRRNQWHWPSVKQACIRNGWSGAPLKRSP